MEKAFNCKHGHTLGRIRWNGDGVPQLMVYRHAVSMEAERPAEVDVMGPLVGEMPVQCDLCGDVRVWAASSLAVAELVLGLIRWNGDGVAQLMIYRHAVDLGAEHPAGVDVMGPLVGQMPVQCDLCGDVQVWRAGSGAVGWLAQRLTGEDLARFARLVRRMFV